MPTNSIHPGFLQVNYLSEFGPHKMIVPTLEPVFTTIGDIPEYTCWDGSTLAGDTLAMSLIDKLKHVFTTDFIIADYTLYSVPSIGAAPQPVYGDLLNLAGLATTTGWAKAVQVTMSMRTTLFGTAKMIFLDVPTLNLFETTPSPASEYVDVYNVLSDAAKAFSGRDNARPAFLKGISITLNEELRRQYHMV